MKIYVAHIEFKDGYNFCVAQSTDGMFKAIDKYVREWWEKEMAGETMPDNLKDRIDAYFEENEYEFYVWDETELLE